MQPGHWRAAHCNWPAGRQQAPRISKTCVIPALFLVLASANVVYSISVCLLFNLRAASVYRGCIKPKLA
eukprot:354460-Chlamydomonas_euryale.AAC.4